MKTQQIAFSRRMFLQAGIGTLGIAGLAACVPQPSAPTAPQAAQATEAPAAAEEPQPTEAPPAQEAVTLTMWKGPHKPAGDETKLIGRDGHGRTLAFGAAKGSPGTRQDEFSWRAALRTLTLVIAAVSLRR